MRITEVKPEYVQFMPNPDERRPGVIYISEIYRGAGWICPCGCKNWVYIMFGPQNWELIKEQDGKMISITPSIGDYACHAHYYIKNNKIDFQSDSGTWRI